jgi:hypothetical protein
LFSLDCKGKNIYGGLIGSSYEKPSIVVRIIHVSLAFVVTKNCLVSVAVLWYDGYWWIKLFGLFNYVLIVPFYCTNGLELKIRQGNPISNNGMKCPSGAT